MQLTQRNRKETTVISEEKVESAFAQFPGKPTQLFLLNKISFPEPKTESAFLADSVFQFFFCPIL